MKTARIADHNGTHIMRKRGQFAAVVLLNQLVNKRTRVIRKGKFRGSKGDVTEQVRFINVTFGLAA